MKIDTVIAANRFGLGARPGELAGIDHDPRGWLLEQLPGPLTLPQVFRPLGDSASILVQIAEVREMRRLARAGKADPTAVKKLGPIYREHYRQQVEARYRNAIATNLPFHERLVHFWSNHFALSTDKSPLAALAGAFENEAIRPNLGGSFTELLLAVERHPAMILYLDNQRSIGPNSVVGERARRRGREVGLNENLAREILELHTLGVDGGYTQRDVVALAKMLTGWSIGSDRGRLPQGVPGRFTFREDMHEPGMHRLLGTPYWADGVEQAEAALRELARHRSTATHIATKLVRHLIADDPPAATVERIARVFRNTDGDLPSVHAALVDADEAWRTTFAKYKTPQDFVVSAYRAYAHVPSNGKKFVQALELMGQTPYRPGSPAGWPDTTAHWGGADSLYKRIVWSNAAARRVDRNIDPLQLAGEILGPALGDHTRTLVARAESAVQGTTLLLASPEFQRR